VCKRIEFMARLFRALKLRVAVGEQAAPAGEFRVLRDEALNRFHEFVESALLAAYEQHLQAEGVYGGVVVACEAVCVRRARKRFAVVDLPREVSEVSLTSRERPREIAFFSGLG
jgi:hypothetical protein